MKLTKKNLTALKGKSPLMDDVIHYVLDQWGYYEDKKAIFTDVLYHGCSTGIVGHLIYYSDTVKYYEDHKTEINELLYDAMFNCGTNDPKVLFGDKWDEEDPLAIEMSNKNLLAWFGFEETMRNLAYNFEELEDHI